MSLKNKLLIGGVLLANLLFNPLKATAEEAIEPKQPLAIERTLEEKTSKPKIEINFNYKTESEQKPIDYLKSRTFYSSPDLWRSSNIPYLNSSEGQQVEDILNNINSITSYQDLITASQNLSENQKLVLSSAIGGWIGTSLYDIDLHHNEVFSQEEFFYRLQNSLGLGTCGHIHTHIERFLNDIGIKSAAVSGLSGNGVGHVYDISKIENKTAVIDYNNILITNTKNIEKTLEAYQKNNGTTAFQHLFFEDAEFKYRLITKDGRNFLNFIGYDESLEPLKNALLYDIKPQPDATMTLNLEDFLNSLEMNIKGFFEKIGEIKGNSSSPLEKLILSQTGFKRKFSIFNDKIIINPDLSFIFGRIFQDADNNKILGINNNLIVNTNKEKGFNLSYRIAGSTYATKDSALFYDFILGGGTSYSIPLKNTSIEPYVVSQFNFFPKDIGTYKFRPRPTELVVGTAFGIKNDKTNLLIDPYYLWKIGEQGFGGNIKLEGKKIGINAKGDATWSNYEFNPDKINLKITPYLNLGKLITLQANYEMQGTNYDNEIDNQHLFGLEGTVKF